MKHFMFKADWEKTSVTYQLPEGLVENMVRLAYPDQSLIAYELISGGCANLNIKIQLEKSPFLLRVYLRDKDSAYKEQKLGNLLKQSNSRTNVISLPIPRIYYIGEVGEYRFAVIEFISGITLRDLLLSDIEYNLNTIMREIGTILSKISSYEFPQSGFFDNELNVITHFSSENFLIFVKDSLKHKTILSVLTPKTTAMILPLFEKYAPLLAQTEEKHLVHGDFDPANILVHDVDGTWQVSAILDWEFAFSGSVLWDVANMLRYAHKMPTEFQDAFLNGLATGGIILPKNWQIVVHLLNLLSLLDCLKRSDPQIQPIRCGDIRGLIERILLELT